MKIWTTKIKIRHDLEKDEEGYADEAIPYGLWYSKYDTLEPADQNMYLTEKDLEGAEGVCESDERNDAHAFDLIRLKTGQFVYVMGIDLECEQ
jgi:hypothetical protein